MRNQSKLLGGFLKYRTLPACVDVVVDVPRGALSVALRAPALAVRCIPDLVRSLQEAGGHRRAVHAFATTQIRTEILQ